MTPADVIVAATRESADVPGLIGSGTCQFGKRSEFLVPDANLLGGITNARRTVRIQLQGEAVERSAVRQVAD